MTEVATPSVIWEEPPARSGRSAGTNVWVERLLPLISAKGEWARVWEGAVSTARSYTTSLKARKFAIPTPDGEWEFVSRSAENGKGRIYARFNG
jgi:hypothetical protein